MAPTNIFVPGVPSIGKSRRRIYLGGSTAAATPYYNFNEGQFAVLSDAFTRVSLGNGRALGVHVGDSTSMGFGGGNGGQNMVNSKENTWPTIMANRLTT